MFVLRWLAPLCSPDWPLTQSSHLSLCVWGGAWAVSLPPTVHHPKDALLSPTPFSFLPFYHVIAVTGARSWYKNMIRLTQWVILSMDTCVRHSAWQKSEDRLGCHPSPTTLFEARVSHFITINAIYSGSYWVRIRSLLCQPKWLKSWRSQNTDNLEVGFPMINSSLLKNIDFVSNNSFPREKQRAEQWIF